MSAATTNADTVVELLRTLRLAFDRYAAPTHLSDGFHAEIDEAIEWLESMELRCDTCREKVAPATAELTVLDDHLGHFKHFDDEGYSWWFLRSSVRQWREGHRQRQ